MNKQELNKYFWLQHEIEKQKRRLLKLQTKQSEGTVGDTVRDYRTGKGIPVKIEGIPEEEFNAPVMINLLEEEIEKNIQESEKEVVKIEKYVQGINNPQVREVMRCRFLDCMQWETVGEQNYISPDHARKIVREHFSKKK